jgi:hypothetical protein
MPDTFLFADEAGCLTFSRQPNVSRYFIFCTVLMADCSVGARLLELRRELAWAGAELGEYFHATNDRQAVRDRVYAKILEHDFTIQATIMEKSKAHPRVKASKPEFYKCGAYYHLKFGVARRLSPTSELLVTTASVGNRKERSAFEAAMNDVMRQTHRDLPWRTDFMPAHANPCLQVADYCAWAIQRKWEIGDERSYALIRDRVEYEHELWAKGARHYY